MKNATLSQDLIQYLRKKHGWLQCTIEHIDWKTSGGVLQALPPNKIQNITMTLHDLLPVNARQHKIDKAIDPGCPTCSNPSETTMHFLQSHCRVQDKGGKVLRDNLQKLKCRGQSDPILVDLLLDWSRGICPNMDSLAMQQLPWIHRELIEQQTKIGWNLMYKGWFHVNWAAIQQQYDEDRGLKRAFQGEPWV